MKKELFSIFKYYHIRPKKELGQNFLVTGGALDKVVDFAGIGPEDNVIEVAAGTGFLTERLQVSSKNIIAIEKDPTLVRVLKKRLRETETQILEADMLRLNWKKICDEYCLRGSGRIVLVGNLPYQIGTLFVTRILEKPLWISSIRVMMQREVAERCAAMPGTRAYGFLSIFVQSQADITLGPIISAKNFYPAPKVDSRMVRFDPCREKKESLDPDFFKFVKRVFQHRRKQLSGALAIVTGNSVADMRGILRRDGWDPSRRPATLSISEWRRLFDDFNKTI